MDSTTTTAIIIAAAVPTILLLLQNTIFNKSSQASDVCVPIVNQSVEKDKDKVVTKFSIPEIEELPSCKEKGMAVMCRCWKSKKFPFCDGSHNTHNKKTGDNVGPLIITCPAKE